MIKSKRIYPVTRTILCPRCRQVVRHILYDYDYNIYKCTNCGNLHYDKTK